MISFSLINESPAKYSGRLKFEFSPTPNAEKALHEFCRAFGINTITSQFTLI